MLLRRSSLWGCWNCCAFSKTCTWWGNSNVKPASFLYFLQLKIRHTDMRIFSVVWWILVQFLARNFTLIYSMVRRVEDEMAYWLGPVFVKFLRLFINLAISIHLFCCAYWRIKVSHRQRIKAMFISIPNTSAYSDIQRISGQIRKQRYIYMIINHGKRRILHWWAYSNWAERLWLWHSGFPCVQECPRRCEWACFTNSQGIIIPSST